MKFLVWSPDSTETVEGVLSTSQAGLSQQAFILRTNHESILFYG